MGELTKMLGKMIGPLPLGAWLIAVVLGVGFVLFQRNSTPTVTEEYIDTSTDPGVGMGGSGMWTDLTVPTTGSNSSAPAIDSNDSWIVAAINRAIADGYDPAVADYSLRRYASGQEVDNQGWAIVKDMLGKLGAMPTPVYMPENKPSPTQPVAEKSVTVNAPSTATVGTTVHVTGTVTGIKGMKTVQTQFRVGDKWSPSQSIAQASDNYTLALTYGWNVPGTYTYRVVSTNGFETAVSATRTITRTGAAVASANKYKIHTVRAGETMAMIATRYQITWQQLLDANRAGQRRADGKMGTISSTATLAPNSTLVIPGR